MDALELLSCRSWREALTCWLTHSSFPTNTLHFSQDLVQEVVATRISCKTWISGTRQGSFLFSIPSTSLHSLFAVTMNGVRGGGVHLCPSTVAVTPEPGTVFDSLL